MLSEIKEFFTAESFSEFMWKMIMLFCLPFMWLNLLACITAICISVFICWLIAIPKSVIDVIRKKKTTVAEEKSSSESEDPWFVNYKSPSLP